MNLKSKTIHFGYAHILPLEAVDERDTDALESALKDEGMSTIMKARPHPKASQLLMKTRSDSTFEFKIEQVGIKQGVIKEPLYAITVIIGAESNYHDMADIYKTCMSAMVNVLGVPMLTIQKEATVRTLLGPITKKTAFGHLWEDVLKQSGDRLSVFGKPVNGGGLRIVLPPQVIQPETQEVCAEEVKIESFLQDPRYIFVEGIFQWGTPSSYNTLEDLNDAIDLNIAHATNFAKTTAERFLDGATS